MGHSYSHGPTGSQKLLLYSQLIRYTAVAVLSISPASAAGTTVISGRSHTFLESYNDVTVSSLTLTIGIYIIIVLKCGVDYPSLIRIH